MAGTLLPSAGEPPDHPLLGGAARKATWGQRLKALVVICTTRLWRGGPRFLLQVTACVLTLCLLFGVMPSRLSGGYETILQWTHPMPGEAVDLRVVAFGSQDLAGSAMPAKTKSDRVPWTKVLCKRLNCISYVSLVPPSDGNPALLSNSIYSGRIKETLDSAKDKNIAQNPAFDLEYLNQQYPAFDQISDLDAQINKFLALPPPSKAPRQTLFIFTFGTWDIWNLAAFPRKDGEQTVEALVGHLFNRIEKLYVKALNPKSSAFSDFWSNSTKEEIAALTAQDAPQRVDKRRLESFRILIPMLFDVTLSPAWHTRPVPPFPHSTAEQMRNAVYLTERWNKRISDELDKWTEKAGAKPEGVDAEEIEDAAVQVPSMDSLLKYLPPALQPESVKDNGVSDVIVAPYPRRAGVLSDPASAVLDAMTEEEMQRSGLHDSKGRGSMSPTASMRFLDVWTACRPGEMQIAGAVLDTAGTCSTPKNHLFYDSYTVSQRAIDHIATDTAVSVLDKLFPPRQRKGWISR